MWMGWDICWDIGGQEAQAPWVNQRLCVALELDLG